jgi:hypothetical protein
MRPEATSGVVIFMSACSLLEHHDYIKALILPFPRLYYGSITALLTLCSTAALVPRLRSYE